MIKTFNEGVLVFTREDGGHLKMGVHPETREPWRSEAEAMAYRVDTSKFAFTRPPEPPTLSPVEFKLLFTAQERVAIKKARATDEIVDDFMELIDDPRLSLVDLGLASVQGMIQYLVDKTILTQERADQVMAGEFQ